MNRNLRAVLDGMSRALDVWPASRRRPPKARKARLGWGWDWQTAESLRHLREDEDRRDGRP